MPDWSGIGEEIKKTGSTFDVIRRQYIKQLSEHTNRNVIIYYSGWLQKNIEGIDVNDADKNGFMTVIHGLNKKKGLDLILHTPGGNTAATESIVDYLRSVFGTNIRAFIPQLAMSAGTMIACSCKEIFMGLQSSLGPIDPQLGGIPAHGLVEEFNRAHNEIKKAVFDANSNPQNINLLAEYQAKIATWQPIISKYNPTLIGECEKAIAWSHDMVESWLRSGMFENDDNKENKIKKILTELCDHSVSKSHARHLPIKKCQDIGLKVISLESDNTLQDLVLSIHHSCIHTLSGTQAFKIIENQNGIAFIQQGQQVTNVIMGR